MNNEGRKYAVMRAKHIAAIAAFLCCAFAQSVHAVWYVDRDSVHARPDGRSWETAFNTIQPAIDAAFTDTYYRLSPPVADRVARHDGLRGAVRAVLSPIVAWPADWLTVATKPLPSSRTLRVRFSIPDKSLSRVRTSGKQIP